MARGLSVFKHFLHVKKCATIDSVSIETSEDGVVCCYIDLHPHKRYRNCCPHCGKRCTVYDKSAAKPRLWRALDFGGVLVYLRYTPCRIQCPEHGVVTSSVPWAFYGSRFTKDFDLYIAWLSKYLSRSTVVALTRIDWKTVGRCAERALKHLDPESDKRRLEGLVNIGVDETSYRKGHCYMTVIVNHDTGEVVWVHVGHGKSIFEKFFLELTPEQRSKIQRITGDGARWIDDCVKQYAPQAQRCVDPFHVVQWANETLDQLRTQIWQAFRLDGRDLEKEIKKCEDPARAKVLEAKRKEHEALTKSIKHSAYALGKSPQNLTYNQAQRLELIATSQPVLYKGYRLKEELRVIFKMNALDASQMLKQWCWRASHSRIELFKELAHKIMRHMDNILNTIKCGLSNARIEATNNKIKLLLRRSYGFRNMENMMAYVKLVCSNVDIPLPNRPAPA